MLILKARVGPLMKYNTVINRFLILLSAALIAYSCIRGQSHVRVSAILVATEVEAQQIMEQLRVGANFSEMARQYSIGPGSLEGGDLGYFALGEMMSQLEAEALKLQVGEYGGVIETGSGYFILMKTEELTAAEYAEIKKIEGRWNALTRQSEELIQQGRYEEAVPIAKEVLQFAEANFSSQDLKTATSLNYLALLYYDQGKYAEAEPLYMRALTIRETALGPDHSDVAQSLNNLAELYRVQGNYSEAEPLFKRALTICEEALGPEHPNVAVCLSNLGMLYQAQGNYTEAELLYKRILEIDKMVVGSNHPNVAASLSNLADLSRVQGKYDEAEPLYKQALGIWEEALGPEHPDVATLLESMAALYGDMGNEKEAKKLKKRAEEIRSKNQ